MNKLSLSYTLEFPGQNYQAVYEAIHWISAAYVHLDESQFLVLTPFAEAQVELFLSAVLDCNDTLTVLTVSNTRTWNHQLQWSEGALRTAKGKLEARPILQQLRMRGLELRRRRA